MCHRKATQRPKFADKINGGHMDTKSKKAKRTLLLSMEDVVTKAKEMSITPEFYKAAALSLKHLSTVLQLTQKEALLLTLFFEMSSSSRSSSTNMTTLPRPWQQNSTSVAVRSRTSQERGL